MGKGGGRGGRWEREGRKEHTVMRERNKEGMKRKDGGREKRIENVCK